MVGACCPCANEHRLILAAAADFVEFALAVSSIKIGRSLLVHLGVSMFSIFYIKYDLLVS